MQVSRTFSFHVYLASLTTVLSLLCPFSLLAEEGKLKLDDFEWTFEGVRVRSAVERERPGICVSLGGDNVEFKSEEGKKPFSIIRLALKAKHDGTVDLIPEFFLVRDGLQYRVCRGIRVVEPPPDPRAEAFFPPYDACVWPGHAGDRRLCRQGDVVVVELLFDHIWKEDAQLLAAVPMASVRKHALYPTNAQQGKSSARGGRHR